MEGVIGFIFGVVLVGLMFFIGWQLFTKKPSTTSAEANDGIFIPLQDDNPDQTVFTDFRQAQQAVAVRTFLTGKSHIANQCKDGQWEVKPLW